MDNRPGSLADTLERVLDKGVVIVGDIAVSVVDIELLTLRVRLFVASAQTAREMGMDWWTNDPFFAPKAVERAAETHELAQQNAELRDRVVARERALGERALEEQPLEAQSLGERALGERALQEQPLEAQSPEEQAQSLEEKRA